MSLSTSAGVGKNAYQLTMFILGIRWPNGEDAEDHRCVLVAPSPRLNNGLEAEAGLVSKVPWHRMQASWVAAKTLWTKIPTLGTCISVWSLYSGSLGNLGSVSSGWQNLAITFQYSLGKVSWLNSLASEYSTSPHGALAHAEGCKRHAPYQHRLRALQWTAWLTHKVSVTSLQLLDQTVPESKSFLTLI